MRKIEYLSPTSIACYLQNREEFYLRYLADERPPREPQTLPMAIGSAFDAYCKNYMAERLGYKDERLRFETLFESQVESQNRDWGRRNGAYVFEQYKSSGALADLMSEIESGSGLRIEFDIRGVVHGYREGVELEIGEVTLLGKPDLSFVTSEGIHVILDWKVNGYCATRTISPAPGYVRFRGAGGTDYGRHPKAVPLMEGGLRINMGATLEDTKKDWAQQLSIYAWLCGEPVSGDYVVGIDQIVCTPSSGLPKIRIAEHRNKISGTFQKQWYGQICDVWDIVRSEHYFREMSAEESRERCRMLDGVHTIRGDDDWLDELKRFL